MRPRSSLSWLIWPSRCSKAHKRGDELHLTEEELAFYDALEVNESSSRELLFEPKRECQLSKFVARETSQVSVSEAWMNE